MKIVVVTATYNEKDNIGKLITLVEEEVFPKIKHYDMCLLVADDNSPDGTADIVMSMDADLQHDPHAIPEFLKKIEQGYDVVCGTRYSDGGSMPKNWPLH